MLNRILAATDGSPNAERAVTLAGEISGRFEAALTLVHVSLEQPTPEEIGGMQTLMQGLGHTPFAPLHMEELTQSLARQSSGQTVHSRADTIRIIGEHHLAHAEHLARKAGAGNIERRVLTGNPVHRILDAAEDTGSDLIVLGACGLGELKRLLLGSVAKRVAEHAPVSCLTAR